ncbi:hypothetical protein [Mucilaginibacter lappiensis]|uniref:hypothetical protein n=1 Tax=Mucilaginibacter lappiensis TaxID=354630 RepID=UPI003D24C630
MKIQPQLNPAPITLQEQAWLDDLSAQIIDAQYEVEQFQTIVNSLTEKADGYQAQLTVAENNKAQAYNHKTLADQLTQSALDLQNSSETAFKEIVLADDKTKTLSADMKILIDKLIYTVEVIDMLSRDITKKKALNPLISDDLINMTHTAYTDADNAVTLTLVALRSTFTAEASNIETEATLALGYHRAKELYKSAPALSSSLDQAYTNADANQVQMEKSYAMIAQELNNAQASLNTAPEKLAKLQAVLTAANAAINGRSH